MHDHDHEVSERLASFADILAGELPKTWNSTCHTSAHEDDLVALAERIWDMDLVAEALTQRPLRQAAVLTRQDGAQLVVLDRHDALDGFLIAALAPRDLPDEAYRGVREPDGIALSDNPFLSAESVTDDLLVRYEAALAQVRHNATHPAGRSGTGPAERVVLTWQADGALTATGVSESAAGVLAANGFVHDEQSSGYRLSGDDTGVQARAVRESGRQLDALGITTVLQQPTTRPTATAPAAGPGARGAPGGWARELGGTRAPPPPDSIGV
ncbi:hypothetical protein ACFXP3_02705 [Streptomyces sp. NPDC059096]|uniref:hypothetical protein n=1 Tax=Streptomyces sp. NPDC059096 TaxID=3346727 RepID=UPI0036A0BA0D